MNAVVFVGIGSNIGDRTSYLYNALCSIDHDPGMAIEKCSSIYETDPYGPVKQADFLNLVVKMTTRYSPERLLKELQNIETDLDRVREIHWGPRTIDLDILLYNHENIVMDQLRIPHPEMIRRAFVMIPLSELAPAIVVPGTGRKASELCLPFSEDKSVRLWRRADVNKEFGLF